MNFEQRELLNDAESSRSIDVDEYGSLHYQTWFEGRWKDSGGDFEELLALISENIFQNVDGEEEIDWTAVERELEAL